MSKRTFQINKELYSSERIQEAISAFDGFTIQINSDSITIEDENPDFVFDELMNYVLSITLE